MLNLMPAQVDKGMLPVENSLSGTIHKNFDLLLANKDVHIIGEVSIQIRHCLMAQKGIKIEDVKKVLSHPVALAQCQQHISTPPLSCSLPSFSSRPTYPWLVCAAEHGFEQVVTYDTAGSAKMVVDGDMKVRSVATHTRRDNPPALTALGLSLRNRTQRPLPEPLPRSAMGWIFWRRYTSERSGAVCVCACCVRVVCVCCVRA